MSPGRRQAIIWTNARILLIGPPRNKLQWNLNRNSYIFIQENPSEDVVWKMLAILSQPLGVILDSVVSELDYISEIYLYRFLVWLLGHENNG